MTGSALKPAWHVLDAQGKTLGRLSTEIAVLLQGKHKPTYVPYLNSGDFVIVVNAEKIRATGKKPQQKVYYRHSGYHGGLKERTLSQLLQKAPTRAIKHAVKGMLPKSTLGRHMLSRLKLYAGESHPHAAQVAVRPRAASADSASVSDLTVKGSEAETDTRAKAVGGAPTPTKARKPRRAQAASGARSKAEGGAVEPEKKPRTRRRSS